MAAYRQRSAALNAKPAGSSALSGYEGARPVVGLTRLRCGAASPTPGQISDDGAHGVDLHR